MMKLLYEESPRWFGILLDKLTAGKGELTVGPVFEQQQKSRASVPDLLITQQPFTIAFETKRSDWFYSDQINRHLQLFENVGGKRILFLLSNFETDTPLTDRQADVDHAKANNIELLAISYMDMVTALESVCTTDYLAGLLNEFRAYLDAENLLPVWRYLLDVVNCGNTIHEIEAGAYICPATGGAYSHKRARLLGTYVKKEVKSIYLVDAMVTVGINGEDSKINWNNQSLHSEQELKARAETILRQCRPEESSHMSLQVFLLGEKAETQFNKKSPGGMLGSK